MPSWWVAEVWSVSPAALLFWVFWVIVSILLHELAHGWTAVRLGDSTPYDTGHMTWNPLVHMGPFSLIAFALVGIAWGAMPIDPSRIRGRHGEAIVAAAGPAMNLVLFAFCVVLAGVWALAEPHLPGHYAANLHLFARVGATLSLVLAIFNLVPVPPLDGSRIAASFIPEYRRLFESENGQWIGLIGFMLLFAVGSDYIFAAAGSVSGAVLDAVTGWLGQSPA